MVVRSINFIQILGKNEDFIKFYLTANRWIQKFEGVYIYVWTIGLPVFLISLSILSILYSYFLDEHLDPTKLYLPMLLEYVTFQRENLKENRINEILPAFHLNLSLPWSTETMLGWFYANIYCVLSCGAYTMITTALLSTFLRCGLHLQAIHLHFRQLTMRLKGNVINKYKTKVTLFNAFRLHISAKR